MKWCRLWKTKARGSKWHSAEQRERGMKRCFDWLARAWPWALLMWLLLAQINASVVRCAWHHALSAAASQSFQFGPLCASEMPNCFRVTIQQCRLSERAWYVYSVFRSAAAHTARYRTFIVIQQLHYRRFHFAKKISLLRLSERQILGLI